MEGQTEQVMKNLGAVLEAAGSSFPQVVKTTVLLTDMADFGAVNAIYGELCRMAVGPRYAAKQIGHCCACMRAISMEPGDGRSSPLQ